MADDCKHIAQKAAEHKEIVKSVLLILHQITKEIISGEYTYGAGLDHSVYNIIYRGPTIPTPYLFCKVIGRKKNRQLRAEPDSGWEQNQTHLDRLVKVDDQSRERKETETDRKGSKVQCKFHKEI